VRARDQRLTGSREAVLRSEDVFEESHFERRGRGVMEQRRREQAKREVLSGWGCVSGTTVVSRRFRFCRAGR